MLTLTTISLFIYACSIININVKHLISLCWWLLNWLRFFIWTTQSDILRFLKSIYNSLPYWKVNTAFFQLNKISLYLRVLPLNLQLIFIIRICFGLLLLIPFALVLHCLTLIQSFVIKAFLWRNLLISQGVTQLAFARLWLLWWLARCYFRFVIIWHH